MSSEKRIESLDAVRKLLSNEVRPVESAMLERASSPFVPNLGNVVIAEEEEEVVLSDEELLTALSDYINPTGIFMFGGEFYLIFKEKKLKIGSELRVNFNGGEYTVTISDITGSTYKVRRGESELQLKLK